MNAEQWKEVARQLTELRAGVGLGGDTFYLRFHLDRAIAEAKNKSRPTDPMRERVIDGISEVS